MLKHVPSFKKNSILDIVLHHHERYDGEGYPHGLIGKNIPLVARIIAVADSFDAMVSNRIYRESQGIDFAVNELSKGIYTQFDPEITRVFLTLIEENKISIQVKNKKKVH